MFDFVISNFGIGYASVIDFEISADETHTEYDSGLVVAGNGYGLWVYRRKILVTLNVRCALKKNTILKKQDEIK